LYDDVLQYERSIYGMLMLFFFADNISFNKFTVN